MSFRSRLTLFFIGIVIVPMIAMAVLLFRLLGSTEDAKRDARVAEGQTAAIGSYELFRDRAADAVALLGEDAALTSAMRRGDKPSAQRRARVLLLSGRMTRIVVVKDGAPFLDVGDTSAIAPRTANLRASGGRDLGLQVQASVTTAESYASDVARITRREIVVRRGGRLLRSTLPGVEPGVLPKVGDVNVNGTEYRAASFKSEDFGGQEVEISVLAAPGTTEAGNADDRALVVGIMVVSLICAFAFAILVSRALQGQIARFLEAAKRLGSGDFSTQVPTDGHDEFSALGEEFNKMSRQLEARLEDLSQERARVQDAVRRIGEAVGSNLDREVLVDLVLRTAIDGVGADCGRASTRVDAAEPLEELVREGALAAFADAIERVESEALRERRPAEAPGTDRSALAYPLKDGHGDVLGMITVARSGRSFSSGDRELFNYLAGQASVSIENVDLHEQVQRQAVTDELTGLFNHRRFQEVMDMEVERARRFNQGLGLVMLDIDDFKRVNDNYGHQQGDAVLREVSRVLRETSREIDEPARYGGEELIVALPQTDLDGAYNLAERIRTRIEELEVPSVDGGEPLRVTASLGVAALPDSAAGKESLIAAADAALYVAKRSGKNRTERAAPASAAAVPGE